MRKIKSGFKIGAYSAADHYEQRCSACGCKLWSGEAVIWMPASLKVHRQCMKDFIERTYELVDPTHDEYLAVEKDGGLLGAVETERSRREFEEYRQKLIDRL